MTANPSCVACVIDRMFLVIVKMILRVYIKVLYVNQSTMKLCVSWTTTFCTVTVILCPFSTSMPTHQVGTSLVSDLVRYISPPPQNHFSFNLCIIIITYNIIIETTWVYETCPSGSDLCDEASFSMTVTQI